MRLKLPKALSDERKRKEVKEKQCQVQQLEEELGKGVSRREEKRDKSRTYNLLDLKEAVQIKPSDCSKAINTKEFKFVQKPRDGVQNWETLGDRVTPKQKKGKELRGLLFKYDLTSTKVKMGELRSRAWAPLFTLATSPQSLFKSSRSVRHPRSMRTCFNWIRIDARICSSLLFQVFKGREK